MEVESNVDIWAEYRKVKSGKGVKVIPVTVFVDKTKIEAMGAILENDFNLMKKIGRNEDWEDAQIELGNFYDEIKEEFNKKLRELLQ